MSAAEIANELAGRVLELSARSSLLEFWWDEWETKVHQVISVDPLGGKTGKGVVKYWEASRDKSGKAWTRSCGQFHAIDIEDITYIR